MTDDNMNQEATSKRPRFSEIAVFFLLGVLFAGGIYLLQQVRELRAEIVTFREAVAVDVAGVREAAALSTGTAKRDLTALRAELDAARAQAATVAGQAKVEAQKHAERLAQELAKEQQRQQEQQEQIAGELTEVRHETEAKISAVNSDVIKVESEVSSTKAELQKTIADLKRVTGDMGVMSGLIATNGKELAALRELGERDYFEFQLAKSKQPQQVGAIRMMLKKAEPKKSKYTLELFADDKRIEKRDKTANEPIQFYVGGNRQPLEIVVFEVKKNLIAGYLATPQAQLTQAGRAQLQ